MNIVGQLSVFPKLPEKITRLQDIANNLWWSWTPDAQDLYSQLDPALWTAVNQNPVKFLRNVAQQKLDAAAQDKTYISAYKAVVREFDAYMAPDASTWFNRTHADKLDQVIAYFSAEFGLHEALPIYSGGLGILSGDHCKEASDLGLPFIGVGFLYPQGYFTQRIDNTGRQQAAYEKIDFAEVPATPALDPKGNQVLINVDLPGRTVYAKVWRIQVGRIPLFLMDTDVERNAPQDRDLSARLYGGDHEMRVSQEVVLGIGGVRALRALGYNPSVWHMNEGHSAFLGLERIRELVQGQGLTFAEAVEAVRASSVFTTHTPVPAGNDAFAFELIEKFFWQYWGQLGINREQFLGFARHELQWGPQFSMTVLALRLSAFHNGVSELHGHVSREMWKGIWPDTPVDQVPITHVTNGVHTKTWIVQDLRRLYDKYLRKDWLEEVDDPKTWAKADIPAGELWAVHNERKVKMVNFVRERVKQQYIRFGEGPVRVNEAAKILDPEALTLGFARRFATYKRATLIFRDMERLKRILNNPERPVQIVFSGKSHPADEPGKALIQRVYELSQTPDFAGKIIFVENYDMNIARHLISGVDVWLNNPRRPYEASGTSGEKAAMSGVPNFSILDGWWREAYDGENGWAIGEEREYKDLDTQDEADALSLYAILEDEIIPLFYERGADGIPQGWVNRMMASIRTCAPQFSMKRMVKDYVTDLYLPAARGGNSFGANGFALAREMAGWKQQVRSQWQGVHVYVPAVGHIQATVNDPVTLTAHVRMDRLQPDDIAVEIVAGPAKGPNGNEMENPVVIPMQARGAENGAMVYTGELVSANSGKLAVGVRVRPHHRAMLHPSEMGLNRWA